jgi:hypothetical protein
MAKFRWEDDVLIADEHGDLDYTEAVGTLVSEAVASIEEALWNLVDDLEYVMAEEAEEPADDDIEVELELDEEEEVEEEVVEKPKRRR